MTAIATVVPTPTVDTAARPGRVASRDGTVIAFDRRGNGQPIILVDGALCSRALGPMPKIARMLARRFTVITYDRRGRGESGNGAPYSVEREIDDLAALIREAGGSAHIFGISSGAILALTAASTGLPITKLALYEAPFIVDGSRPTTEREWARIDELVAAGDRGAAVKTFLGAVGVPAFFRALLPLLPVWSKAKAVAHTLPHDGAIVRNYQRGKPLSTSRWASVTMPTLVMDGSKSPAWIRTAMQSLTSVLPNAKYQTLRRQTHDVSAQAVGPVLEAFFLLQDARP